MGPIRGIRFIHAAIRAEAAAIDEAARAPEPDRTRIAERVRFLARANDLHTKGEEASVFPALEEKRPGVAAAYLLDHADDRLHFEELARLAESGPVEDLRRAAAVLRSAIELHVRKEEELIAPLVESLFTVPEQAAQIGRMMATFAPADLAKVLPWMIGWLSAADRVAYMSVLAQVAPPERFAAVAGWVKAALPADEWAALRAGVPALPA